MNIEITKAEVFCFVFFFFLESSPRLSHSFTYTSLFFSLSFFFSPFPPRSGDIKVSAAALQHRALMKDLLSFFFMMRGVKLSEQSV